MHNLKEVIKRLTQEGTPLGDVLVTEKKSKKHNSRKSAKSHPTALRSNPEPEDYDYGEFVPVKILHFNNTPFEAHFKQSNTVTLTNLNTYESYITPCLWDSKQMQDFHYHLQIESNWERYLDGDHLDQNYHVTLRKDDEGRYTYITQ